MHFLESLKVRGIAPSPRTAHLHGLVAVAAMLMCLAVVVNVGPSGKVLNPERLPATDARTWAVVEQRESVLPVKRSESISYLTQDVQEHTPSLAALTVTIENIPSSNSGWMQPSPFPPVESFSSVEQLTASTETDREKLDPSGAASGDALTRSHPENAEKAKIVGLWAPDAGTCSARDFQQGVLPTVINAEGAWAGETFCLFTKRTETEAGWNVVAKCSTARKRWTSNVRLAVSGDRLTWISKRGTQVYTRCAPDVLMAQAAR